MKRWYAEEGIDRVVSFPIPDHDEEEYMDKLFIAAQHINDLINEQGHTVYLHDTSGLTRAPTLALIYLCLFVKIRTYENLPEACALLKQYHSVSTPNLNIIKKVIKKNKAF